MNPTISSIPAIPQIEDFDLVLQENEYLRSIQMPEYSMESEQDIAEAARNIRHKNDIFLQQNSRST